MKKISALIAMLALITLPTFAQQAPNLNQAQLRLRQDIMNFLKEEGYAPSIDDDGDVKFKCEGYTYYVKVAENNTSPMFIKLYMLFSYNSDITKSKVTQALTELNKYKAIKVNCYDRSYQISYETFTNNADIFKVGFYKLLDIFDSCREEIRDL